jgi:hypothetical protein
MRSQRSNISATRWLEEEKQKVESSDTKYFVSWPYFSLNRAEDPAQE